MKLPPLPQQVTMSEFMVNHAQAAIFAEPGLGKTRATLDAIDFLLKDCGTKGTLVIAPKRVASLTWPNEVRKWCPHLKVANLRTPEGAKAWERQSADIYVTNVEYLQQSCDKFLAKRKTIPADLLVLDELSKFKSHDSKRAKALFAHRSKFTRFIGLTGTPAPNSHLDLYNQIKMLDGGERLGKSFHAFRSRYASSDYCGFKWTINPGSREAIEAKIADITLVMLAKDWLKIPPVTVKDIDVVLPAEARKLYLKLEKDMLAEVQRKEVVALSAAALVTKLRQITGGAVYTTDETTLVRTHVDVHSAKIDALKTLHGSIQKRPLLVAIQYEHERERIKRALPYAQDFDEKRLDEWNAGKIPLWIAHPLAMAHGINAQGFCRDVCWFSPTYSREDYSQFNARVARTGQQNETTIYRLLAEDTVDWSVAEVLNDKGDNQRGMLENLVANIKLLAELRKSA
jgi:SNF2 family DNA or RNA helicase